MRYDLPIKSRTLLNRYLNIKVAGKQFPCPYYQNVGNLKKSAVFVGKGLPDQIESEASKLFNSDTSLNIFTMRLYMVMAGLGVDCSGFASRLLDSYLRETIGIGLRQSIKFESNGVIGKLRFTLRPFTNLSANMLTSRSNTTEVKKYIDVRPGDLLRLGSRHVAIVVSVEKKENQIKITYAHSTIDYGTKFGVRKGNILIVNPTKPLENQIWDEIYLTRNYMYDDFINSPPDDRGFRRLTVINIKTSI